MSTPQAPVHKPHEAIALYYDNYNAGNIDGIAALVAEDVEYWDTIYSEPLYGRQALLTYLRKVRTIVPPDLRFVIEDVTTGDPLRVGVIWHVECGDATVFPFSHGCSFYKFNELGQMSSARDVVEPASKPGSVALSLLAGVTPLVRKLGPASEQSKNLRRFPAVAVWALYAGYVSYVLLGSSAPGLPAYQTTPEQLAEVVYQSLNFFYVNIGLDAMGLSFVPSVATPPVSEALFNFVNAWSLMFLPVLLSDGATRKVENKTGWWLGIMFLTNLFMIPFLAVRAEPQPEALSAKAPPVGIAGPSAGPVGARQPAPAPPTLRLPSWSSVVGAVSLGVGLFSVYWALEGRPEYGDLSARAAYLGQALTTNRIFYAFVLDMALYSVWQAVLLEGQRPLYRFTPFLGLVAYCMARPQPEGEGGGLH